MRGIDELLLAATPSPTPTFDPVDVTPGPVGFFATIGLMLAVGLVAMAFMRQSTRAAAKYDLREQAERDAAARAAAVSRGTVAETAPTGAAGSGASSNAASSAAAQDAPNTAGQSTQPASDHNDEQRSASN